MSKSIFLPLGLFFLLVSYSMIESNHNSIEANHASISSGLHSVEKIPIAKESHNYQPFVNSAVKILLPIEVLGAEGTINEREFTLTSEQVAASSLLWLQVNNLGYENKASIKINDAEWVDLNHNTTKIQSPEKERGGMAHGGHSTIRFTIPATGLISGLNKISFRFNMSDAISNGYRVVRFNLLDIGNNKILDESFF